MAKNGAKEPVYPINNPEGWGEQKIDKDTGKPLHRRNFEALEPKKKECSVDLNATTCFDQSETLLFP